MLTAFSAVACLVADGGISAARGTRRLTDVAAIPVFDGGAHVEYEGSIDRSGGNDDWDWGQYQDENGEWVLAEDEGAGCVFNFTQHRFSDADVVFRFYFDGEKIPRVTVKPSEFGSRAPFVGPLAGKFMPPKHRSLGRDFAIVRSFVPMEYTNGFKVTSSVALRGLKPGGWGHVLYHRYSDSHGVGSFRPDAFDVSLGVAASRLEMTSDRTNAVSQTIVPPGGSACVCSCSGRGALSGTSLIVRGFLPQDLTNAWIVLTFDSVRTCEAPVGTFFGCESAAVKTNLETALIGFDIRGDTARFSNRFPMPYFSSAEVCVENRGAAPLDCSAVVGVNETVCYDVRRTGLFCATRYLPPTACVDGRNTLMGAASGCGHLAYAVLTGRGIKHGCEGDVRIYLDRFAAPAVQSDGTESFGSWGWGFCRPAQAHPFSMYSGIYEPSRNPYANLEWSLLRLLHLDSCPFRHAFRFELEHGTDNHAGGRHSGQVFYYKLSRGT